MLEINDYIIKLAKDKLAKDNKDFGKNEAETTNVVSYIEKDTVWFNFKKSDNKKKSIPVEITTKELVYSIIPFIDVNKAIISESKDNEKVTDFKLAKIIGNYILFLANKSKIQFYVPPIQHINNLFSREIIHWVDDDRDISISKNLKEIDKNKRLIAYVDSTINIESQEIIDMFDILSKKDDILILRLSVVSTDTSMNSFWANQKPENYHPISYDLFEEMKDRFINHEIIYKFADELVIVLFK